MNTQRTAVALSILALCLSVAPATLAAPPAGAQDEPTDQPGINMLEDAQPLVSPDGVRIDDFREHSAVWGRGFDLDLPDGEDEWTLTDECARERTTEGVPETEVVFLECLEPYIASVYWTDGNGTPISTEVADLLAAQNANGDDVQAMGTGGNDVKSETDDFTIYDNVDCCNNKKADGYVVWKWRDQNGDLQESTKKDCSDQDTSSGKCDVSHTAFVQTIKVANQDGLIDECDGHRLQVEFWDEDVSSDDLLDISIEAGQAWSKIEIVLATTLTDCADSWYGDRDSTDSGNSYHCHYTTSHSDHDGEPFSSLTFCELVGQYDATGDNDDAGLEFSVVSVT